MACTDPKDTLAYHGSRVFCQHRDMSGVSCADVAKAMKAYKSADQQPDTKPETEALWFYGLNHAVSLIASRRHPLEPLDSWEHVLVRTYHAELSVKAIRAMYYLTWITIREARHCKNLSVILPKIEAQFGAAAKEFFAPGGGEDGISARFLNKPPAMAFGPFVKAVAYLFHKGSWNSSYGGPKWGAITDCLVRFVHGEYSAEMMMDTIWTLQHNGGCLFNKGQFYGNETHTLKRILDVQRGGQVPEAVLFDSAIKKYAAVDLRQLMSDLAKRFPDHVGSYVDWIKVKALGALQDYHMEIEAQKTMDPAYAKKQKAAEAAAIAAQKVAQEAAEKEAIEHQLHWYQVMPDVEVPKYVREIAA